MYRVTREQMEMNLSTHSPSPKALFSLQPHGPAPGQAGGLPPGVTANTSSLAAPLSASALPTALYSSSFRDLTQTQIRLCSSPAFCLSRPAWPWHQRCFRMWSLSHSDCRSLPSGSLLNPLLDTKLSFPPLEAVTHSDSFPHLCPET